MVKDGCMNRRSSILPCDTDFCLVKGSERFVVDAESILSETGRNFLGSFAKFDPRTMAFLETQLRTPGVLGSSNFDHAFLSNTKQFLTTAFLHANPMTTSMAIQYVGKKTWFFIRAADFLSDDGFGAVPSAPLMVSKHAPKRSTMDVFLYTSEPGDILFFPPNYAHLVVTHSGPNIMVNYRKFHILNFLQNPNNYLHSLFNLYWFGLDVDAGLDNEIRSRGGSWSQTKVTPEKQLNLYVAETFAKALCADESANNVDHVVSRILWERT